MGAMAKLESGGAEQVIMTFGAIGGYCSVIRMVSELLDKGELIVYTAGRTQPKRESDAENRGKFFGKGGDTCR